MSLDGSLRLKSSLVRHRNVLTRAERVAKLMDQDRLGPEDDVLGLPKVSNRKPKAGGKKKKKAKEEE